MSILSKYPHLAARIFNTPLLVHPQKLDAIIAGLGNRLLGTDAAIVQAANSVRQLAAPADAATPSPEMFTTRRGQRAERGYSVVDGVAVLSISGALVHRSRIDADSTFLQGYNSIAIDLQDAVDNPDVHAILQVYDSPGGEVSGAFELAQRIYDLRGKKPIHAIADSMAASAAYLTASAADSVAISTTGYVGSIGVVMRHVDLSRAIANEGVTVTHIYAGAHKVDANPYEPLPPAVRDELRAEIEDIRTMFVDAVSRHRGISADAVRGTEAALYRAQASLQHRLADRITTTDALIAELAAQRARSYPVGQPAQATATTQGETMSGNTTQAGNQPASQAPAASQQAAQTCTQADLQAAVQAAVTAERERSSAILAHPEATGRHALALQCIGLGLSVEQAGNLLAAAPREQAAGHAQAPAAGQAAQTEFERHMQTLNPGVSGVEPAAIASEDDPRVLNASWDRAFGIRAQ